MALAGTMTLWPSRRTLARGAVIDRSAITARSARCSWRNPITALMITITPIATASRNSPSASDTTLADSSSQMTGLANWRPSRMTRLVAFSRRISFGPTSLSLRCASSDDRPTQIACDDWVIVASIDSREDDMRIATAPSSTSDDQEHEDASQQQPADPIQRHDEWTIRRWRVSLEAMLVPHAERVDEYAGKGDESCRGSDPRGEQATHSNSQHQGADSGCQLGELHSSHAAPSDLAAPSRGNEIASVART